MKGAPDILINNCKWIMGDDGEQAPLDAHSLERLRDIQNEWCLQGQRVLLICKKTEKVSTLLAYTAAAVASGGGGGGGSSSSSSNNLESYLKEIKDLCVVGMVGIIDKPRDGIDQVIRTCRQAGIRVFMVTGDFHVTAAAIASQIGIFSSSNKYDTIDTIRQHRGRFNFNADAETQRAAAAPLWRRLLAHLPLFRKRILAPFSVDANFRSLLLTGNDLEHLDESSSGVDDVNNSDWRIITKYEEIVFARTTPTQKLKVVEEFKRDKNIVAVTGDGVNDSPALKAANIGIAMGGGSEVAMEAAQMVLLDNSFNSIVVAIENGRLVFENLRKVILYLLPAGTFSEIVPLILNIYLGVPLPMSAFQMICICILTDLAPSLAMMFEKSEGDLLERAPRVVGRDRLVDSKLILYAYFFLGVFESFFSNFMFFLYLYWYVGFEPSQVFLAYDKWTDGYGGKSQSQLNSLLYNGQTISFASLVIVQTFGNVFITRTHKLSLMGSFPVLRGHRNLWLFVAQLVSIALLLILIYVPFFNTVFLTSPIPVQFYFIPLIFCIVFIALDEIRKLFFRKGINPCASTAW